MSTIVIAQKIMAFDQTWKSLSQDRLNDLALFAQRHGFQTDLVWGLEVGPLTVTVHLYCLNERGERHLDATSRRPCVYHTVVDRRVDPPAWWKPRQMWQPSEGDEDVPTGEVPW